MVRGWCLVVRCIPVHRTVGYRVIWTWSHFQPLPAHLIPRLILFFPMGLDRRPWLLTRTRPTMPQTYFAIRFCPGRQVSLLLSIICTLARPSKTLIRRLYRQRSAWMSIRLIRVALNLTRPISGVWTKSMVHRTGLYTKAMSGALRWSPIRFRSLATAFQ